MQKVQLPIFPLELVVFENEIVNLHIFETKYKKLIGQCLENQSVFFIPTVINGAIFHSGCELQVDKLICKYDTGAMDISCKALRRGLVEDFLFASEATEFSSAIVEIQPLKNDEEKELNLRIVDLCEQLYETTNVDLELNVRTFHYLDIVHKCGLTLEHELELVALDCISDRQTYLINHLKSVVLSLAEIEGMKRKIQLNGHFKRLSQSL